MNHLVISSATSVLMLAIPLLAQGCARRAATEVPHPSATNPQQVLANIARIARDTGLAQFMNMPELRMERNELRAERILYVRTDGVPEGSTTPDGYLVAELVRPNGEATVDVAIAPDGSWILGAQDTRDASPTRPLVRPLGLSVAAERISQRRGGKSPQAIGYRYFHNTAEPFANHFRPLVAAFTESGIIYMNSAGHAFANEGSPLLSEFGARGERRGSSVGTLIKIGEW